MFIELPEKIKYVLSVLEQNGFEAYIVGGCVRDLLLGNNPTDYDVTTNALPFQIKPLFKRTIDTGIKHGTVSAVIDGEVIEITTYRTEGKYTDSRRPDSVQFVSNLSEDLSRRDFTVNAICYNEKMGIIDLFGGRKDLENKILRTVGNPETRFKEDALRIMRLFRFASVLDFTIEKSVKTAAIKCSDLLQNISKERIQSELLKTLMGDNLSDFEDLVNSGTLNFLDIAKCTSLSPITLLPKNSNLRLFAFMNTCCDNIVATLSKLKFGNGVTDYCKTMKIINKFSINDDKITIKNILRLSGENLLFDILSLKQIFEGLNTDNIKRTYHEIKDNNEPYLISHLDIKGDDIEKLGFSGKDIGVKLNYLLNQVILNPELNQKQLLINIIK